MAVSIEEARAAVLEHVSVLDSEDVSLDDALGRALADDAIAPNHVPPFAASAMDGYAIIAADTASAAARLEVVGESKAGTEAGVAVRPGTAVRISTGAPVPDGADAIVPQELTSVDDSSAVHVDGAIREGLHVRPAGEDIRAGELVIHAGSLLGPAELGVLASLNIPRPRVVRRPARPAAGVRHAGAGCSARRGPPVPPVRAASLRG